MEEGENHVGKELCLSESVAAHESLSGVYLFFGEIGSPPGCEVTDNPTIALPGIDDF